MMKTVDVTTMQNLDRRTIEELGIPSLVLMERAALGVISSIHQYLGHCLAEVHIVVGTGNNGGDGLAVARLLQNRGLKVKVWWSGQADKRSPDNQHQWNLNQKLGIQQARIEDLESFQRKLSRASLIVDSIFGVGLNRTITGPWSEIIKAINQAKKPVVAIDIPSGLDGNTGQILGLAIQANLTVTCGLPKWGLLMDPALDYVGKLEVVDIGIPPIYTAQVQGNILDQEKVYTLIPAPRSRSAHKGNFGKLAIVAGSLGMSGAATLATKAALHTGVGIVYTLVPASIQAQVAAQVPEALVIPLPEEEGKISPAALPILQDYQSKVQAFLVGPGMGVSPSAQRMLQSFLNQLDKPVVLDADGLNNFTEFARPFKTPTIITPHVSELGRLLKLSAAEIQNNRVKYALRGALNFNCTHILKGASTLIASPSQDFWVNLTGNPGLARGGSGDVLAGLVAGLLAQGYSTENAALFGVYWHGLTADQLANQKNEVTITVGELISYLPQTYSRILKSSLN